MSDPTTASQELSRPLNTAIVGGGQGCEAVLKMVEADTLGHFRMRIVAVADRRSDAPGLCYAREHGVPLITADYREILQVPDLDLVIELTGSMAVRDELERARPRHVHFIDHFGARLFWQLHQAQQSIITQRTEMRERVEEERKRIQQIFDSIPDQIVLIDPDMRIQRANASFYDSVEESAETVQGRYCYDVEHRIRGDCQVAVDNCLFADVMRDSQTHSLIRKHFDKEGNPHYTSLVAAPLKDEMGDATGVIEMSRDITHRIRLEEELKATEIRLQQFMEMAPLASWVKNTQGQYLEANPAMCKLLGRSSSQILGHTDLENLPREAANALREGDRRILAGHELLSYETQIRLDETLKDLSIIKYPVLDGNGRVRAVGGVCLDVTARKRAERELVRTQEYLQSILDNSPLAIITTDLDARIVSFNRGAEKILGYETDEVKGRLAADLYATPGIRESLVKQVEQSGAVSGFETDLLRKDGSVVPMSVTIALLTDSQGNHLGTVGIGRDVSQRKELMNQIIRSERLAAVGRLAAGVAHEINNPLAIIKSVAGFMQDLRAADTDEARATLEEELEIGLPKIEEQVRRCRSITARLLGFARKSEARLEVADVNRAIVEVLPFLEKEARMAQIQVHRQLSEDLPKVKVEDVQLEELLINLITNAIQALAEGAGGNIWIRSFLEESKVIVSIRDDGPGIAAAVRDRLFDPFVSTKPMGQGTGLGLSICYGIVKRYDGEIRVESEEGQGATFYLVLPVNREVRSRKKENKA